MSIFSPQSACKILVFLLIAITSAHASPIEKLNKTCQCHQCNFTAADLSLFRLAQDRSAKICSLTCNLSHSNFTGANLSKASFVTCVRGYLSFVKSANLSKSNFTEADAKHLRLIGVNIAKSNFTKANLMGAQFFLTDASYDNFSYAKMNHLQARMDAMHGWGSNFSHANFSYADLSHAHIYAVLKGANFTHANLSYAVISLGQDTGRYFKISNHNPWKDVNFTNANLTKARIQFQGRPTKLKGAILCHTTMPDGKISNRDC